MRKRKAGSAPMVVTTDNFGDLLVQGAREAVAIARGELAPARIRVVTAGDAARPPVGEDHA